MPPSRGPNPLIAALPPLHDAQREIVDRMATLARERFADRAARYDAESSFPYENYEDLRTAGLLGLTVPKAYGGLGADSVTYAHALRELAKGCPATALTFNMHATVLTFVAALGTEAQKRRYFGDVVERGKLVASITSEPEQSFRDKFVLQTVFRPVAGGWQVAAVKHFCSLGDAADYYFVTGIVEGKTTAREGVISAMIPRSDQDMKVESVWNATGMRGTISHTIRYNATVPQADIIGVPGQYLTIDLAGFALGYAAVYLGIGEAAFEYMVEYAKTKTQRPSNVPLCESPVVQRTIADLGIGIRTARLLLHEAARLRDSGDREATMLAVNQSKVHSAEVGLRVTEQAVRLAGGRGILKELPVERWHRDALAGPVMPPSTDRCLETSGKQICGLPAATLEFQ
jgi:alkylation response protein AidB-like acyl-CoA dehydrogenase